MDAEAIFTQLVLSGTSNCDRFEFPTLQFRPTVCASCGEAFLSHTREAVTPQDTVRYIELVQQVKHNNSVAHCVWSDVASGGKLFVGGYTAAAPKFVQENGITHIVNAAGGLEAFFVAWAKQLPTVEKMGVHFLKLGWDDVDDQKLWEAEKWDTLRTVITFIDAAIRAGGRVVVHCAQGKSRSATAATAYLMARENFSRDAALAVVRRARRVADPNDGFMRQLAEFEGSDELSRLRKELSAAVGAADAHAGTSGL